MSSKIDAKIKELLEQSSFVKVDPMQFLPESCKSLSKEELEDFVASEEFEDLSESDKLMIAAIAFSEEFMQYLDKLDESSSDSLREFSESEGFHALTEEVKKAVIHKMQNWGQEWGNVDPYTGETLSPSASQTAPNMKRKSKEAYSGENLTPSKEQTTANAKMKNLQKEHLDLSDDISTLVEGEDLSEEFKTKAATIFEAAVLSRVKAEFSRLNEEFETRLEEEVETLKEGLIDKVDGYLNYVVEQWMNDNELALESGLKNDIMESFMTGMKSLFEQHYIEVPDEKLDVFEELADRVEITEARLNEQFEANVELRQQMIEMRKALLIKSVTEGMTATDAERLVELTEDLTYSSDESFIQKLQTIKESYFDKKQGSSHSTKTYGSSPVSPTMITEETKYTAHSSGSPMDHYLRALNRMNP